MNMSVSPKGEALVTRFAIPGGGRTDQLKGGKV